MNALEIRTFYSALATLLVTFTFSYAYKIQKKPSSFSKCLASGIILSALIFHIIPEIYESETAPLYCAFSFIFLFAIDKIYLEGEEMPKDISVKKAICFVFLLSLHSFFEGLGCCLRESLTSYLIGLLGHKWAEAFVFGVSIRNVFNSRITFGLICLYSILTPVGMLIGIVFKDCEKLVGIMDGLSGGSFFYIGFVEMLNSEFVDNKNVRRKTLAVVYGFCLMSVVFYIMNEIEKRNQ